MPSKQYSIAAIDDHPMVLQGLKSLIKNFPPPFQYVGEAKDGKSLRFLLKTASINTLILDLNMPETNTYRLIKDIIVSYPEIKIIAYSMYESTKLINDILELGVHAFVSKTSQVGQLKQVIEEVHAVPSLQSIQDNQLAYQTFNQIVIKSLPTKTMSNTNEQFLDSFLQKISLSSREIDVLTLIARGQTNQKISEVLYLSKYTIETHRKNIKKKLKIKTSAELIRFAARHGIL